MENKKINIQNQEKTNIDKLLNPVIKRKKESNLESLLKEIDEIQNQEEEENNN